MMFAAAVGHRSGRATPSLRDAPQRQSMEIVGRETIYRNRNAVQTNPATSVFVERLWRSVKYEEVYLRAYDTVAEARGSIGNYLTFYNRKRPHSSLDGRTPDQAYFRGLVMAEAA
jgi:transposase InsO family protein